MDLAGPPRLHDARAHLGWEDQCSEGSAVGRGSPVAIVALAFRTMTIVDDLLANTGMYIGIDEAPRTDHRGAARVKV